MAYAEVSYQRGDQHQAAGSFCVSSTTGGTSRGWIDSSVYQQKPLSSTYIDYSSR